MTHRLRILTFAFALIVSAPSLAQEYFQLPDQTTVIRLRPEPLQWTPESVTVITSDQLNETYRSDLEDLEGLVPGLIVDGLAGTPGGAAISMRGVGAADTSKGLFPVVAVRVDGVNLGTPTSLDQLLFDVDRIEVDRGPQGVWQGAPAPGGVINLYRSKPTGKFSARTRLTMGDFERKRFDTVINFPLAHGVAGKFTFIGRRGGRGLIDNVNTGRRENEDQLSAASLSLLWHNRFAEVQYTYDHDDDNSDVPALLNLSSSTDLVCIDYATSCSVNGAGRIPETRSYTLTSQGFSNRRRFDAMQHTLHINFGFKGLHVASITALRNTNEDSREDVDGTSANFYSVADRQGYHQLSEEINAYKDFPNDVTLSFGAYLFNSHYTMARHDYYVLKAISDAGYILPVASDATRFIDTRQERRLRSAFVDLSYPLAPKWKANLGIRAYLVRTYIVNTVSQPNPASNAFTVPPDILVGGKEDHDHSANASLSYKVDDTDMIYMRYTHSFRPGGFDDLANSADSAGPYKPEHVDAYEVGLKSHWFNDHVHFSYVAYREDYKDKLVRYPAVMPSGRIESVLRNTSYERTFGHEIELTAIPMDNLLVRASLSHASSHYINYAIPDLSGSTVDLHATLPTLTPPDQFRVSALYTFPYWQGEVRVYGAYRFTTSYWSNPQLPAGHVNTFAVMDFSIDYSWNNWKLRFFSENFNDRRYLTNAVQTWASQVASLNPGTTSDQSLMTTTQYDRPRFNGLELIYTWSGEK